MPFDCLVKIEPFDYVIEKDHTHDSHDRERGRYAYEAYRDAANGVSVITGDPLPHWDELIWDVQRCWIEMAAAVCLRYGAIY